MSTMKALACPHCGAPVAPSLAKDAVTCAYCRRTLVGVPEASWGLALEAAVTALDRGDEDPRLETVVVAGRRYGVLGRLASGESTDAFLGKRLGHMTELVVIRVARADEDRDLVDRGARAVFALHESEAQGAPFFTTLLPQMVGRGTLGHDERPAVVHRWRSGFHHTMSDVMGAYPDGVDARTIVWMWRRMLELLGFVHRSGWVHGAVVPQHVLVHPRDHGIALVGYAAATRIDAKEPLPAAVANARDLYPEDWSRAPATPELDITMASRLCARLLGASGVGAAFRTDVPRELGELVVRHADPSARGRATDAWELGEAVSRASQAAFGPPQFHPFTMPGWP